MPTPMKMRRCGRTIDRRPGVRTNDPVVRAALGISFEHKLSHLVLMPGKIGTVVKLLHELANFVMSLANFEPSLARLLRGLRVGREERDVALGVPGIKCPAVACVELVDRQAILG